MGERQPREVKRRFLHAAWVANSLAYFMQGAFATLAPFVGVRLGLSATETIWLVSSLLFARAVSFWVFWKWEGWHYHKGWSLAALGLGPVFLTGMFFGPSAWVVLGCCGGFGLVIGLGYYMSIFYSMDYGPDKGEGGGLHESLIGCGFLAGPLSGAVGLAALGSSAGAQVSVLAVGLGITAFGAWRLRRV